MDTITYYLYYLDALFYGFPLVIRIAVVLTILLNLLYVFFLSRLVFFDYKDVRLKKCKDETQQNYEESIATILSTSEDLTITDISEIIGENENTRRKNCAKEQITELIISLKNQLCKTLPNHQINIKNYDMLLSFFGLHQYWEKQIVNGDKLHKIDSIRKLHDLGGSQYKGIMSRYLYHQNSSLRKLARTEHLKFDDNDAFIFLEEGFDKDFNKLDEIRLHEALKEKYEKNLLPTLTRFISGTKDTYFRLFIIREIRLFNQHSSANYLSMILSRESDSQIKKEIIDTLGKFKFEEALDTLYEEYNFNSVTIQEAIIDAIIQINNEKSLSFLKAIHSKAHSDIIQEKIEFAIAKYEEENTPFAHYEEADSISNFHYSLSPQTL